jgi:xanthine dehydrogenase accessory factor
LVLAACGIAKVIFAANNCQTAMNHLYSALLKAMDAGEPCALGIISRTRGSSPQKPGAKALFFADGRIVGTLGGGCLEAEVRERARESLRTGKPAAFDLVLDHDFGWDDGLICGGRVSGLILPDVSAATALWTDIVHGGSQSWGVRRDFTISREIANADDTWLYRETTSLPFELWIAGSGHVAQALAGVATQLEFAVTVFDDRPAFANRQRFPDPISLRVDAWEKLLASRVPQPSANNAHVFGLIVTRGHQHDAMVLRQWVRQPFAFLGMIGSARKRRVIFSEFIESELATQEQLDRVECPVGISIGAVSVAEIAISVAARLVQRRAELKST